MAEDQENNKLRKNRSDTFPASRETQCEARRHKQPVVTLEGAQVHPLQAPHLESTGHIVVISLFASLSDTLVKIMEQFVNCIVCKLCDSGVFLCVTLD